MTAWDAVGRGFRTIVVGDCTNGVATESTEAARMELEDAGVEYLQSWEVKKLFEVEQI